MTDAPRAIIVGAGVAGLTAALAMARRGLPVRIYERAPELTEVGAGLQLSPNATRLLARLGVLDALGDRAVRPQAVELKKADGLSPLARVPLGAEAETRWGAPYLVAHRADLQNALLQRAQSESLIEIVTGAFAEKAEFHKDGGVRLHVERNGAAEEIHTPLLIAGDGVWSHLRRLVRTAVRSRFTGFVAWRATLPVEQALAAGNGALEADRVTAFMHPAFHLVATRSVRGRDQPRCHSPGRSTAQRLGAGCGRCTAEKGSCPGQSRSRPACGSGWCLLDGLAGSRGQPSRRLDQSAGAGADWRCGARGSPLCCAGRRYGH
ncbi:FAD-dependent monooxygenase [Nitratireductor aquibiodomus]|uniref:FAD-dependent monooxygenase n=1 Tax=Nitratireductor aquibiodomus TaxID=204799 RepID=UPI000317235E